MFKPVVWFGSAGLLFGLLLDSIGLWCAGAGHGTYLPIVVFAAPFSLYGNVTSFVLTPFLWLLVGIILGTTPRNGRYWSILVVLTLHYASAAYLVWTTAAAEWPYLQRTMSSSRLALCIAVLAYVVGQLAIWIALAKRIATAPTQSWNRSD